MTDTRPPPSFTAATARYWGFYWPLAIMGIARIISLQFQNGILARYPEATQQLANLAIASGLYALLHATLIFLPETVNVFSRSSRGKLNSFRFTLTLSLVLTLPMLVLTFTPVGATLLKLSFNADAKAVNDIQSYFRWLLPVLFIDGIRQYYTGLLVQAGRTKIISVLNVVFLSTSLACLLTGFSLGFAPLNTVGSSQLASHLVVASLTALAAAKLYRLPAQKDRVAAANWEEMWRFFWPVALTGVCFALSRPIIFGFASRQPDSVEILAALRVSFEFALLFFVPINAFRAVYVTYGRQDPVGVRRFLISCTVLVGSLMVLFSYTPASHWFFHHIMGLEGDVLRRARLSMMSLCLIPWIMAARNYFHGLAMANRTTKRIGIGGIVRVATIITASFVLTEAGLLNEMGASITLSLGFLSEVFIVGFATLRKRRPTTQQTTESAK